MNAKSNATSTRPYQVDVYHETDTRNAKRLSESTTGTLRAPTPLPAQQGGEGTRVHKCACVSHSHSLVSRNLSRSPP